MLPMIATYRLQFRNGMTFDKAVEIVPYLKRLGISHLYASPIMTAVTGSNHGYDVTDYNEIDPAIGGMEGFERLHQALRRHEMGLILDIVPNHMAASLENRWWRSVVEHGAESPYARHLDIDWSEKLTLPVLGRDFEEVLAAGELGLEADAREGCLTLAYYENRFPLHPSTYHMLVERLPDGESAALGGLLANIGADAEALHDGLRKVIAEDVAGRLSARLNELSRDSEFVARVHAAQPWRLLFWQEARRHLSYRRFFEVTGLVGVRVEDDEVFDDAHRLVLSLVRSGKVDGLRIDHVDGLARPAAYLQRLRHEIGPDVPIWVEKILAEGERLPVDWPISGTTGYEFIPAVADLLVESEGRRDLELAYDQFTGQETRIGHELCEAKLLILRRNFEGELTTLVTLAANIAQETAHGELGADQIRDAIAEIIVAFPVYRTYGEIGGLTSADEEVLSQATSTALRGGNAEATAIRFVSDLLRGGTNEASRFRTKFQQLTGPIMAKSVEDTLFYRHNAFIALNEVGSTPGIEKGSVERFHRTMGEFAENPPGLLATATHDTKRGEDVRARLYALSEQASLWSEAVARWSEMNARFRSTIAGNTVPEPVVEWLLYQALAGVWPAEIDTRDAKALENLSARFLPYLQKALREAKLHTDWIAVDEKYEEAAEAYARRLLDPANRDFLADFAATLVPVIEAGAINSLAQTLAKLTAPGIPDIYQGAEGMDLSLVDPDNRRAIDFEALSASLGATPAPNAGLIDGTYKQWMIAKCLACRRANSGLFARGRYIPVVVAGEAHERYVAYLREADGSAALVVLPRLSMRGYSAEAAGELWLEPPESCQGRKFRGALTGSEFTATPKIPVADVLCGHPVALALSG